MGPRAGARRLPRRLRLRRPEDALQDRAGRAAGGRPRSAATPTSAPATTTRRPRGCTRTSGLFTADPDICADLTDLFNVLTGYSRQTEYRSLLVAPHGHARRADRAHRARDRARPGRAAGAHPDQDQPPRRRADHRRAVPRLAGRRAGRAAGAHVLHDPLRRAGAVARTSRTRSILGRFLEHSRDLLLRQRRRARSTGSARPTSCTATSTAASRCSCQVARPARARATCAECLDLAFDADTAAWELQPDGEWVRSRRTHATTTRSC